MKSHGFPKIYAVGSSEVKDVFNGPVEITEKLDGSCIGFGKIDGELVVRSKNKELNLAAPENMFTSAVLYIKSIQDRLPDNVFFYGECISKPRHNVLTYERIPNGNVALFAVVDVKPEYIGHPDLVGPEVKGPKFHTYGYIADWARELGMGIVQLLWDKEVPESFREDSSSFFEMLLSKTSRLGGKMEGIVIKNYNVPQVLHGRYCPVTIAKLVSDSFKEVKVQKIARPDKASKFDELLAMYKTEARWQKAIQHLAEMGELNYNATDIGPLIKEVHKDLMEECAESFRDALFNFYCKQWLAAASDGFANFYKKYLMDRANES